MSFTQDATQDTSHNGRPFVSESLHSFFARYRITLQVYSQLLGER